MRTLRGRCRRNDLFAGAQKCTPYVDGTGELTSLLVRINAHPTWTVQEN